ncbi:MAG: nucleotidyltransferase family protein [Eudoraea sp.]|nr:nucleotidyltransferase family protein [Muriicola sp.]NNE03634.1 nucleotidyltransferase family protein [Eudoraea sp.]NNL01852.1 nucleotidyltransferase family protein [Eudoraea sp.]
MNKKVDVLILAAGSASRMGELKQLMPWKDTTLLGNAIQIGKNCKGRNTYAILGAQANKVIETIREEGCTFLINTNWELGMGSSLSYGIQDIASQEDSPDAILVTVADQPYMNTAHLNTIINLYSKSNKKIIATEYKSKLGVPAIFDKALFSELKDLSGDIGASNIIKEHQSDSIGVKAGKKLIDLDTQSDYKKHTSINK